ncbi:MAG: PPOX class F420-dependent oxidoreductase [SAR202 cluster bacterium]|nr:PPOX class F420-dependent oxidoreductase [SAR202 cluster bacterium]MDP6302752.1 PPOX class F420-dependent oxidoreductase [SAR202 cluster bacterium]MDP7104676.1 PPOX class F420-dependent oxidoreductase [SAR202 cluster bacterium]MDP7226327.1 PPOX class F420-dependent oxidoreductase [SAR202 cluster bacterium]MDP7414984.1 PPOX class F420-dependent oxidoreductase [SAR202 cluster bacterium]
MALSEKVRAFVSENKQAVLSTFRGNGAAQLSIVTVCPFGDGVGFSTTTDRAKLINARRDPRCSLLISKRDWWGFVVLEGQAQILEPDNTDADELRLALRDVYRGAAGKEHPDWADYDAAMVRDSRAVMVVVPDRVYGTAL